MIDLNSNTIPRLYVLYERYFDSILQDVAAANISLGSSNPEKVHLERLTLTEFEAVLTDPTNDREAVDLWVQRITRGHEQEFPDFQAAG